jgi:hypothetical protein
MASLSLTCLFAAAAAYHLSPQGLHALQAIRTVEGGQERQEVCANFDGSCDLGPFQVNDKAWVANLASRLRADRTVVRATLRDDGCWNAQVASWIFRQELDASAGNIDEAIGNYHSHWPVEHFRYRRKVAAVLQEIDPDAPPPALPDGAADDAPGALRIPPDVAGQLPGLIGALPGASAAPQAKMITVPKDRVAEPGAEGDAKKPAASVKIYRGGSAPGG